MTSVFDVQQFAGLDMQQPDSVLLERLKTLGRIHASTYVGGYMDIDITPMHILLDYHKGEAKKYTHRRFLKDLRAAYKAAHADKKG